MKKSLATIIVFSLLVWAGSASALTITDLYGDKDGFGLGFVDGYTQPTWPAPPIVQDDPADVGTITDMQLWSDQTWSHTYDISDISNITSASLEIFTYAQGWTGISSLYVDDIFIGVLKDGDHTAPDPGPDENIAWLETFDLMSIVSSLDGASILRIDTTSTNDWWYLDYSELTITGDPVPEPSTLLLLGVGMLGLIGFGRKKFKK